MAADLSEESLKQELKKFPSTFDFDSTNLTKDRAKNIIRKLEDDRNSTRKLEAEYVQINNFLSYLYFLLGEYENARKHFEESLQKDPDNLTANTNKARILLKVGEIYDVNDILTKLQKLKGRDDFDRRKCFAKADLAYAYSRSGPWYLQKAVDLFTQVIALYPTEYAWQYGLGLTLLRQTHLFISQARDRFNPTQNKETTVHAAELFLTVAMKSKDTVLQADAYARLGTAVFTIWKNEYKNVPEEIMLLKPKEYFERAVKLCPEEPSVLEICGRFARYRGELDTSEKLLKRSLQIKPTCHAYHHLALTLKRRVENRSYKKQFVNRTEKDLLEKANNQESRDPSRRSFHEGQGKSQQTHSLHHCRADDHSTFNISLDGDCNEQGGMYNPGQDNLFMREKCRRGSPHKEIINSPLKVFLFPENDLLIEAIKLLEKAEELTTEYGLGIEYEKGIIYRMLDQTEKAVKTFKTIVSKKKNLPTKSLLTNVYEQLGLCLLELSKCDKISPDIQQKYKKDGQVHLLHAVELQSEIVANGPHLKEAWNSYQTLKQIYSDDREGEPRQLAVLHMLMGDHRDSIDVYNELFKKGNDKMTPADCVNLLKCYQKVGKFEECGFLLRSWECTTMFSDLPKPPIFDVYIDCAFHAYRTDNAQLAYQHFRSAFKVYGLFEKATEDHAEVDDETTKDILILHTCPHDSECKLPRNLGTILEDVTGLRYTINSDDVLPNKLELTSVVSFIQNIPCIIIMTHESSDSYHQLFVDEAIRRSSKQSSLQLLAVSDDKCNIPDMIKTKPFIRMPPLLEDTMDPKKQIPEVHQNWIKEFISLLKPK